MMDLLVPAILYALLLCSSEPGHCVHLLYPLQYRDERINGTEDELDETILRTESGHNPFAGTTRS